MKRAHKVHIPPTCSVCNSKVNLADGFFCCLMEGHTTTCSRECLATISVSSLQKDCATTLLQKILAPLSSMYMNFPDRIFLEGTSTAPSISGFPDVSSEKEIKKLMEQCEQAPVGKGEQTILDTNVRSVLQANSSVKVEWPKLDEVLSEIKDKLLPPGSEIKAEFYKLLVYRPGDFFHYHSDSKKTKNHVLTLAVDCSSAMCEGGEVYFRYTGLTRDGNDLKTDEKAEFQEDDPPNYEKNMVIWKSKGAGNWCCWFCTTPHRVNSIKKGYRIICTYNIFTESKSIADGIPTITTIAENPQAVQNSVWLNIPTDVFSTICSFLFVNDLARLSETCCYFRNKISHIDLLTQSIRPYESIIRRLLPITRQTSLGFVLQNRYSFDGEKEIPIEKLHGRDFALAGAFRSIFGVSSISTTSCNLVEEVVEEVDSPGDIDTQRFRISCGKIKTSILNDLLEHTHERGKQIVLPAEIIGKTGKKTATVEDVWYISSTNTELDEPPESLFLPFCGIVWISSANYLRKYCFPRRGSYGCIDGLWGNESAFSLYFYKDVALVVKVDEFSSDERSWSRDILL